MRKVESIKRPLKKGEKFFVPCFVRYDRVPLEDQEIWLDISGQTTKEVVYICPIINHPHNDIENGQKEVHYHLDYRFIKHRNNGDFPDIINKHSQHIFGDTTRPGKDYGTLQYFALPVRNVDFKGITPITAIRNSKLKHKCIHKGKCPHRGYDLSQVKPINGIIKCPLHGLKFDAKTNKMLSLNMKQFPKKIKLKNKEIVIPEFIKGLPILKSYCKKQNKQL